MDAELNLAENNKESEQWVKVRLLFVRGNANGTQNKVGKHDWAVFLSTDPAPFSTAEILELYAQRKGHRSLFQRSQITSGVSKRAKQPLCGRVASIHTPLYPVLSVGDRQTDARRIQYRADATEEAVHNSADISFVAKLWQVFLTVITGALDELRAVTELPLPW